MQAQLNFRQSLIFRAIIYLSICIVILAGMSIAAVYFYQHAELDDNVLEAGQGLLDSYVNES